MPVGRESERVGPSFFPFGRSIFSERKAAVGVYIGSLPRAAALLVGTPAGREDERSKRFFLLYLHHLMFTDCEGESVEATVYSRSRTFVSMTMGRDSKRAGSFFCVCAVRVSWSRGRGAGGGGPQPSTAARLIYMPAGKTSARDMSSFCASAV